MTKTEIRLSGKGGQGIIKSAVILADAALRDGYNVIQSQDYGPQSRGGASKGEVIISSEAIYYPKVELPDIVVCLSQEACDKYAYHIAPDGVLIIDGDHCSVDAARLEGRSVRSFPLSDGQGSFQKHRFCRYGRARRADRHYRRGKGCIGAHGHKGRIQGRLRRQEPRRV
jgi:Pyruvate/2-oxoacid:ferredoxin oxidoreductase gamma subunit